MSINIPKRNADMVTMTTLLSFRMSCLLLTANCEKNNTWARFSRTTPDPPSTLVPAKGKASSYWLTPREHLYPDWRILACLPNSIAACLESFFSFAEVKDDGAEV